MTAFNRARITSVVATLAALAGCCPDGEDGCRECDCDASPADSALTDADAQDGDAADSRAQDGDPEDGGAQDGDVDESGTPEADADDRDAEDGDADDGGRTEFNGSVDGLADGAAAVHRSSFGPWPRADIPAEGSIVVDDGDLAPLRFESSLVLRFELPSAATRVELQSADETSTAGQRDPLFTQADGETQYIAFSFLALSTPQTGGWGWLILQGKSLISNTHPDGLSPQVSLINEGSGTELRLRTIGGRVSTRVAHDTVALSSITPGVWYDVILGVRAEVTTAGWAQLWIVPAGSAMPDEAHPTAQILDAPTNYIDGSQVEPILWRQGLYHAAGASARDLDILMAPMIRTDTFVTARAYFDR